MGHRALLLLGLGILAAGCGPKLIRETVFENEQVTVELRQVQDGGEIVQRGFRHPATIADVRIAHILASLSHQDAEGNRKPTIRSAHVYDLAEGMAMALEKATPNDEVIGIARSRDRRLALFTTDRITAFRSFIEGDDLVLEFFVIERRNEEEARRGGSKKSWQVPLDMPDTPPPFTLMPGEAQRRRGPRGLSIAWRDDFYRDPVSLRFRSGQVRRRTILMELPEAEPETESPSAAAPRVLSEQQLDAMDRLEAARRAGFVTESEYTRRRRLILEGRLDEAGYGPDAP